MNKDLFNKIKAYALLHKVQSGIAIAILAGASYYGYGKLTSTSGQTLYTTVEAAKGTIVSSVTGSGQVSASDQLDIKPKASGDVIYVGLTNGQTVSAGDLIAELDTQDAEKAVRDAETNLESANISLQKILQLADQLSITEAEDALASANQTVTRDQDNLATSYDDAFNAISSAYINLAQVINGIQDVLYKNNNNAGQDNISYYTDLVKNYNNTTYIYRDSAATDYQTARSAYDKAFLDYKLTGRDADKQTVESLLQETVSMTNDLARSAKSTSNFLSFVNDQLTTHNNTIPTQLTTSQSNLDSYTTQSNSSLSSLNSAVSGIKTAKDDLTAAQASVNEKTQSLAKLKAGSDPLDIASAKLSVEQRQNALQDAKDNLNDYYVRAPFAGTITKISVIKGDPASSGSAIATLVTNQKLATVSLNEVDVSKIKIGDKATVTFDAIDGLTITGKVVEIDTIGTVSQGVVTYNVKISFDTQDDLIKAGMSMSAAIITSIKSDVIVVPNSAVKSRGNEYYVQTFPNPMQNSASPVLPKDVTVQVGDSNDTQTEITSGINEGDNVVTRTVAPSATSQQTSAAQTPSLFGALGGGGTRIGGGGVFGGGARGGGTRGN